MAKGKPRFTTYAKITDEQRDEIVRQYRNARYIAQGANGGSFDPAHLAVCVADSVFEISSKAHNGPTGANVFAACLAVLVMRGEIKPVDGGKR
jgi:hypothetical protein